MASARRTLESWKAIAEYVGRDVRTVMRWERDRGLPVRRLPGGKSSTVFAHADEIDAWQHGSMSLPPAPVSRPRRRSRLVLAFAAAILLAAASLAVGRSIVWTHGNVASIAFSGDLLIARDGSGRQLWRYHFDRPVGEIRQRAWTIADLDDDGRTEVIAAVPFLDSSRHGQAADVLYVFSPGGAVRWTRTLDDRVTFGSEAYAAPWVDSAVYVYGPRGARAIAWAAHHYTWWPALLVRLDAAGRITNRFAHPGWIEDINATRDGRWLIVSAVNNGLDTAVTIVLDGARFGGTVRADSRPEFVCATCGEPRVAHYVAFPRTEVSRAAPFRIGSILSEVESDDRVRVHVIQTEASADGAEVIYEFAPDFRVLGAAYSDSYWRWHRRLEADGRLRHPIETCAERSAPAARTIE